MHLYVLGGKQRKLLLKQEEEWNLYESALILKLDTQSGSVQTCVEYRTPPDARAHEDASILFKSGTRVGDILYACTNTEVLVFKLPQFQILSYVSLTCFNDVHHVVPSHDGTLLAATTGLDMVVRFTPRGELLEEWSVLQEPPWQRFSRTIDYRKVESTKPHQSHPNFVFELGQNVWVTRLRQRDAICLTDPGKGKRIDLALESPHDGFVRGKEIFFTLVDGRVVVANADTLMVDRVVDLKTMNDPNALLGWCRGVLPLQDGKLWVGFTRVRKTRIRENILWVKHVFRQGMIERATHIGLYDVAQQRCLQEFDLEAHGMNIVFSVLSAEH
jgi:hypothetical protein